MKNIMLLILTALIIVGCEYRSEAEIEEAERLSGFNTVVIDSCEYLERRQKELEKLITELKEK